MKKKKGVSKKKIIGNISLVILVMAAVLLLIVSILLYFDYVDAKAERALRNTDSSYTANKNETNSQGLYSSNIYDNLEEHLEKSSVKSVAYKFENESFYLVLEIEKDDEGETSYTIEKIVDDKLDIKARINMKNIRSIEYRTSSDHEETLLKLKTDYDESYFAMIEGTYYFLGQDIESISYMDDQFYYLSYNPDYQYLEEANNCSKETKAMIDGFNMKDYYYKYGKINFLTDYYQKLASKIYTVEDKCGEFTDGENK